jgi:hypothetical protein
LKEQLGKLPDTLVWLGTLNETAVVFGRRFELASRRVGVTPKSD